MQRDYFSSTNIKYITLTIEKCLLCLILRRYIQQIFRKYENCEVFREKYPSCVQRALSIGYYQANRTRCTVRSIVTQNTFADDSSPYCSVLQISIFDPLFRHVAIWLSLIYDAELRSQAGARPKSRVEAFTQKKPS